VCLCLTLVADDNVFHSWEDLAARGRIADAVVIATQDSMHVHPAIAFANLKYHILLEKPMAVTAADCAAIVAAVRANDVKLAVR
jgi:predicted dehydrogenase